MGSTFSSNVTHGLKVVKSVGAYTLFGWNKEAYKGQIRGVPSPIAAPSFLDDEDVRNALQQSLDKLSDEQIVKICRQLQFWHKEVSDSNELLAITKRLIHQSLWFKENKDEAKVPTVRFGKTELQMPIVTCGGMRLQATWLPDIIPVLRPSRKTVLKGATQENLKNCIRECLKIGINHFETARMYGTSEYQIVEALSELIAEGEIKRDDFILQTKIPPGDTKAFRKAWNASWTNIKDKLGYVDLLSVHCVNDVNEKLFQSLDICEQLKNEGIAKFIGFSTHGTTEQILNLINTNRFDYVNVHHHYFGDYHGAGTPDGSGGEGNLACVKRALELDMGVFQISPFDKGGKLYRPSRDCALLVGQEMTPMAFAALYAWKKAGMHTLSVGLARPSDLDEVMGAVYLMKMHERGEFNIDAELDKIMNRFHTRMEEKLGKQWTEKGLLDIPSCFDESTSGIAIGHTLWLHNLLFAFGMYEFSKDRYLSLEGFKYDYEKTFQENAEKMPSGNIGRCYDDKVDLTKALGKHYNPSLAMTKVLEMQEIFGGVLSDSHNGKETDERWQKGYDLTVWEEMPGEIDSRDIMKVVLQGLTGGRMGLIGSGPGVSFRMEATKYRETINQKL